MNDRRFFGISSTHDLWKSTTYYICQTPSMALWVALNTAVFYEMEVRERKEKYKNAVKSFPYEVGSCRCKDCRYFRLTKSKN